MKRNIHPPYAFRAIDAGESFPVILGLALDVLGGPLMFLLYVPTSTLEPGTRWWGDSAGFIIGLGALNSILWGSILAWVYRSVRLRREARAAIPLSLVALLLVSADLGGW